MSIMAEYYDWNDPKEEPVRCHRCNKIISEGVGGFCKECSLKNMKGNPEIFLGFIEDWDGYIPMDFLERKSSDYIEEYVSLIEDEWNKYIEGIYDNEKETY